MLDIRTVREEPDRCRQAAIKKHFPDRAEAVDRVLALDGELRALTPELDRMRSEQKAASKRIGRLPPEERALAQKEQQEFKAQLHQQEERERELKQQRDEALMLVPQIPDDEVPDGKDDSFNVEVRTWGEPTAFDFEARAHDDLAHAQGWLDVEKAAAMAGSRNYMLLGDLARLHDAVLRYASEHMVQKGFTLVDPPVLVREAPMRGTAFFPGGEEQTYHCERDDLYLIGTSEVPVTSLHGGEILEEHELPKRYVGRSLCFRREAGTYGKDTKGLYRVHQFQKVEQVIVDIADRDRSIEHHHAITKNAEDVLQAFGLPYRVVLVCGGDLGVPQAAKYDIECWMPSRNAYGETHSASRFYDYQARRLNLRYRPSAGGEGGKPKPQFCHTLNNTVLASPRILIPLLEVHQQADGRVRLPECLRPLMGGQEFIGEPV